MCILLCRTGIKITGVRNWATSYYIFPCELWKAVNKESPKTCIWLILCTFFVNFYILCNMMIKKVARWYFGEGSGTPLQYSCLEIPWTEEPGRLQSMRLLRVGHDWVTSLSLSTFMHWRRKWQPTPVFLPEESQGRGSLVGCRLWGRRVGHNWRDLAAADDI